MWLSIVYQMDTFTVAEGDIESHPDSPDKGFAMADDHEISADFKRPPY